MSPSLNYITFQHRQRTKSERISGFPRRNLQSAMRAQSGTENQVPSNLSPTPRANGKIAAKPRLEPVKLDDSTLELVQALLKPKPKTTVVPAPTVVTAAAPPISNTPQIAETVYEHMPPPAPVVFASHITSPMVHTVSHQHTVTTETTVVTEAFTGDASVEVAVTTVITAETTTEDQCMSVNDDGTITTVLTTEQTTLCEIQHTSNTPPQSPTRAMDESDLMDTEDSVIMSSGGSAGGSNDRKRKHRGARSRRIDRRGTLSPASVRAMLFQACEETAIIASSAEVDGLVMQEARDGAVTDSPVLYQSMVVESTTDVMVCASGSPDHASVESRLHASTPATAASEALYHLQCPAEEDLLSLEDFDRADSPQHEHGKKFARSGTPSTLCALQSALVPAMEESAAPIECSLSAGEERDIVLSPVVEALLVSAMDETAPEMEQEVMTVVIEVQPSALEQGASTGDEVPGDVIEEEDVCMEYASMITTAPSSAQEGDASSPDLDGAEAFPTEEVAVSEPPVGVDTPVACATTEDSPENTADEIVSPCAEAWEETAVVTVEMREETVDITVEMREETSVFVVEVREESTLTTAEMEVIEDFGRELDDILCDVSALGASPASLLRAPHSPRSAGSPLSDAEIMCFSPYVPSQSTGIAEDTTQVVVEDTARELASPVESALVFSPAVEETEQPMEEQVAIPSPVKERREETPADIVSYATLPAIQHAISSPVAQMARIAQTPVVSPPASFIIENSANTDVDTDRTADLSGSSPAPCDMEDCTTEVEADLSVAPEAEADRSVDLSGYSDGDLSTSLDDSQILFAAQDPELEDFEMLESMVQREYSNGELSWEYPLPALGKSDSSHIQTVVMAENPTVVVAPSTPAAKSSPRSATSSEVRWSGVSSIPRYSPSAAKFTSPSALVSSPVRCSPRSSTSAPSSSSRTLQRSPLQYGSTASPRSTTVSAEKAVVVEVWPKPQDILLVRASAQARYEEKLKVARWQYEWEVVSAQAANSALIRLNRS
jgi:hypothetical protein